MKNARVGYIRPRCSTCIFEVGYKYLLLGLEKSNFSSEKRKEKEFEGVRKFISILHSDFHKDAPPNEIASKLFKEAEKISEVDDIWRDLRMEANLICNNAIPYFETMLNEINLEKKKERLQFAINLAVLGNNIDLGTVGHDGTINESLIHNLYKDIEVQGFAIYDFEEFYNSLVKGKNKRLLVVLDNAGEIAFDRLLIRVIKEFGVHVTAAVKGGPISNDAIIEDAKFVGLDQECDVITTGSADLGYYPKAASPEFMDAISNYDIVLLKGMANFESIYAYQHLHDIGIAQYYCLLKIKCKTHSEIQNIPYGSYILKRIRLGPNGFYP